MLIKWDSEFVLLPICQRASGLPRAPLLHINNPGDRLCNILIFQWSFSPTLPNQGNALLYFIGVDLIRVRTTASPPLESVVWVPEPMPPFLGSQRKVCSLLATVVAVAQTFPYRKYH